MWPSRFHFLSSSVRRRLLLCFLLSLSLPVSAEPPPMLQKTITDKNQSSQNSISPAAKGSRYSLPDPSTRNPATNDSYLAPITPSPVVIGPISFPNPLAITRKEIGGLSLFLGVLALFWWVYQLKKTLNELYDEFKYKLPDLIYNNSHSEDHESRIFKLERYRQDYIENINKINTDLIHLRRQAREALVLANTVDSIQKHQTNTSYQNKKDQQTGELSLPTFPNNSQDDLPMPFENKYDIQPNIHVTEVDLAKAVATKYHDAVSRDDRSALRQMVSAKMSITQDCEEALLSAPASATTQLQIDKQGGSYLLISQDNNNWLVPTFQTLKSFTTIQPAKGLFVYERDNVSSAELRRPAEVMEDRGVWVVVNMGVVAVPA
jgi:hypothetical protein